MLCVEFENLDPNDLGVEVWSQKVALYTSDILFLSKILTNFKENGQEHYKKKI